MTPTTLPTTRPATQPAPAPPAPAPPLPGMPVEHLARLLRVERGDPRPEELAALIALLYGRQPGPPAVGGPRREATAGWSRPERERVFDGPRTWRARR